MRQWAPQTCERPPTPHTLEQDTVVVLCLFGVILHLFVVLLCVFVVFLHLCGHSCLFVVALFVFVIILRVFVVSLWSLWSFCISLSFCSRVASFCGCFAHLYHHFVVVLHLFYVVLCLFVVIWLASPSKNVDSHSTVNKALAQGPPESLDPWACTP